jgi:hypothetical protein
LRHSPATVTCEKGGLAVLILIGVVLMAVGFFGGSVAASVAGFALLLIGGVMGAAKAESGGSARKTFERGHRF